MDTLDETYDRLHDTGPEYEGWLSNHAPMAADALIRLGCADEVEAWVDHYRACLDSRPSARWAISHQGWRDPLGDASRLGDWLAFFDVELAEQPWTDVLDVWWPRLVSGAIASAGHGLIRTGHAVRALREEQTPSRIRELAQALGYWAARWSPLPAHLDPAGDAEIGAAIDATPALGATGGIRARLAELGRSPSWSSSVGRAQPVTAADDVPDALDTLVDASVTRYARWASGSAVMLVHASTVPRAAALVLPSIRRELWVDTWAASWAASVAIHSLYRPVDGDRVPDADPSRDEVVARAASTGDPHAIKFTEVALESHARGNPAALRSALRASALIGG